MADFRRAFVFVRLARSLSKMRWRVRDKRSTVYTRMVLAGCLVQVRHAGEDCPEMRIDLVRGRRKEWLGLLTVVGRSVSAQFRGIQHWALVCILDGHLFTCILAPAFCTLQQ